MFSEIGYGGEILWIVYAGKDVRRQKAWEICGMIENADVICEFVIAECEFIS